MSLPRMSAYYAISAFFRLTAEATITVNSLEDPATPPSGKTTLRSALNQAASGETIDFHPSLNGCTIKLSIVGEENSTLVGEIMQGEEIEAGISQGWSGILNEITGHRHSMPKKMWSLTPPPCIWE